ncbi:MULTISPECIES: immunity 49 family protein [unclassified Nocardiopsis]|uniref:immunity 49 family protein n=1 Tax=unclassified Nocardiopsis TaxID=2649073 RepID=UPI0033EFD4FB
MGRPCEDRRPDPVGGSTAFAGARCAENQEVRAIEAEHYYQRAQEQLALDREAALPETRRAWERAMLASYAGVRRVADAIGSDYDVLPDARVRLRGPAPDGSETLPEDWSRAFYLTMVLRDRARCRDLCDIPPGIVAHVARDGTPRGSVRTRNWIDSLQSYVLDLPGLVQSLEFLIGTPWGDDPLLRRHDHAGNLLSVMRLLFELECYDPEGVEEHLVRALTEFTDFREKRRAGDPGARVPEFPLELMALACRARDMDQWDEDFTFSVRSPLLPDGMLSDTWNPSR